MYKAGMAYCCEVKFKVNFLCYFYDALYIYSNVYRVDQEIKTGHLVTSLSNKNNVYKNMVTPG